VVVNAFSMVWDRGGLVLRSASALDGKANAIASKIP
jgi:hypothetical protein